MVLRIFSPGLDQYGPGGTARIKALIIGGPGSGKTRWSSFFPKPFFADNEAGLASIRDRGTAVAAAKVSNSDEMLELLVMMEQECRKPIEQRRWDTLIIDTLDAFQRKVKDEWLRRNPNVDSFRGFDAWGYLDGKMQILLTRLLNLDMNIVVTVHHEEKTVTEGTGDAAERRQVTQLQLSGSIKDQVFNDFDLVGFLGVYYEAVGGQRVQKRGLTFTPTYERPFLKDRLNVTPPWMEVTFSEDDYNQLFQRITELAADLPVSQELGEVPSLQPSQGTGGQLLQGGALPEVSAKDVPLEQFDKPTLITMARKLEITGVKGNTIKSELVQMIRAERARRTDAGIPDPTMPGGDQTSAPAQSDDNSAAATPAAPPASSAPAETPAAAPAAPTPAAAAPAEQPAAAAESSPANAEAPPANAEAAPANAESVPANAEQPPATAPAEPPASPPAAAPAAPPAAPPSASVQQTEAGPVDTTTGEILQPPAEGQQQQAVSAVQQDLGGEVISDRSTVEAPSANGPTPAAPPAPPAAPPAGQAQRPGPAAGVSGQCEKDGCDVELAGENPDLVKLSFIKFRKRLCNNHYQEARAGNA